MNRRQFLQVTAIGAAGLGVAGSEAQAASPRSRTSAVVDTHLHCFAGADDSRFPYHPRAPYRPEAAATPQHLLKCMDEAGVDFAVVVHPEPYQDDHRYLENCLEVGGGRLKGTALVFADRPGSVAKLPDLVHAMPIIAVRIHAYAPDRLPPFGRPELRDLWKTAAELGIAVQLHFEPRYAPGFEPLIREFKETPVVMDHLGRPFQGTPEEHDVVVRWSRFPHLIMKLSAIPSELNYPHREISPVIRRLTDAYGPDRLIYGGGFGAGATGESYRAARERVRSFLTHLTAAEQAKVFGENAVRLFGFSPG